MIGEPPEPRPYTPVRKDTGRILLGATVGAVCGFLTYWSGAALFAASALIQMPYQELPNEFLRPFQTYTYWELVIVGVGALWGAIIARYRWHSAGVLSYVGLVSMIAGFLVYSVTVAIPRVPPDERWLSYFLLAAEAGGLGLIAIFAFYTLDASTRRRWMRRPETSSWDPSYRPTVALMVPIFNEDTEMVEQTVLHLVNQDYPRDKFLVVVCDDSTDTAVRDHMAAFCKRVGAHHVTRRERRGFKAGALNNAIRMLDPEVEYVAVIDADYWVSPRYVRSVVGYFVDPELSFVQTPQDYRNLDESFLTRNYKRAEAYFYHGVMPSRNEENAIIFCGTMGILRRSAVDEIGGFAEDQICEDAEISVRLAANGWRSLYVDQSFGKGLMPAVFEAYKKQFYRWAFGNVRILFTHFGTILRSKMRRRQKIDFLVNNLHWFDGFFVMGIALVLLYLGLGPVLGYDAATHHQHELELLALVPMALLLDGIIRLHLILGQSGKVTLRETLLVQGTWFAIKFTNLVAVTKCMLGFKTPFIRTPKSPGRRLRPGAALGRALRLTRAETFLGTALVATAGFNAHHVYSTGAPPTGYLLAFWLVLYGMFFLAAPIYAYLSYRTLGKKRIRPLPRPGSRPHERRARRRHRRRQRRKERQGRGRRAPGHPGPRFPNGVPLQAAPGRWR